MACACCAESGTRFANSQKIDAYYLDLLGDVGFGRSADLYVTEAGFDIIDGLESLRKEYESDSWIAEPGAFSLGGKFNRKNWRFDLRTKKGTRGTLTLPLPTRFDVLKVDIHDKSDTGLGPLLYKEMVFEGRVTSGTGFFRSGLVRPASFTLVFQGRGNGCDNATDFRNWHLVVYGPKAHYSFYGETDPKPAE
jgi:hypothetical protein